MNAKSIGKWILAPLLSAGIGGAAMAADGEISELSPQAKIGKLAVDGDRRQGCKLISVPEGLSGLPTIFMPRGELTKPSTGFSFVISKPATVFICVHARGKVAFPAGWEETDLQMFWEAGGHKFADKIFRKYFSAGKVEIPTHSGRDGTTYGIPHQVVVDFSVNATTVGIGEVKTVADAAPTVINAGLGGRNSRDLLGLFESKVSVHKPNLVILMAGCNDMLNSSNSQMPEDYRKNMLAIIDKIRGIGARTILINMLPCNESYVLKRHGREFFGQDTPNGKIAKANRILMEIAAAEKIPLVDAAAAINSKPLGNNPDSLLRNLANSKAKDGVHPTAEGYRLIAQAVAKAIVDNKIAPVRIVCFGDSITYGIYVKLPGTARKDAETYPGNLQRLLLNPDSPRRCIKISRSLSSDRSKDRPIMLKNRINSRLLSLGKSGFAGVAFALLAGSAGSTCANPLDFTEYKQVVKAEFATPEAATRATLSIPPLHNGKKLAFTTRWDDSNPKHLKMAQILTKNGFKGSFMINEVNSKLKSIGDKIIGMGCELGNHTANHPHLETKRPDEIFRQIILHKIDLETIFNRPVVSFALPYSSYKTSLAPFTPHIIGSSLNASGHYVSPEVHWNIAEDYGLDKEQFFSTFFFSANDHNPQPYLFENGMKKSIAKALDHPLIARVTFGVHTWQDEKGFQVLDKLYAKYSNNPEWWYCTDSEFGAHRYCFFYSTISKMNVNGRIAEFTITRFAPVDLGSDLPLSVVFSERPELVETNGTPIAPQSKNIYNIPNNPDRQLPTAIELVSIHSKSLPGINLKLRKNNDQISLFLSNNTQSTFHDLNCNVILPPRWNTQNMCSRVDHLLPGKNIKVDFKLPELNSDPELSATTGTIVAKVDLLRGNETFRLYTVKNISATIIEKNTPRDTAVSLGPLSPDLINDEFMKKLAKPNIVLASLGHVANEQWFFNKVSKNRYFMVSAFPAHIDNEFIQKTASLRKNKRGLILTAVDFDGGQGSTLKLNVGGQVESVFLNGKKLKSSHFPVSINTNPGLNRIIIVRAAGKSPYEKTLLSITPEKTPGSVRCIRPAIEYGFSGKIKLSPYTSEVFYQVKKGRPQVVISINNRKDKTVEYSITSKTGTTVTKKIAPLESQPFIFEIDPREKKNIPFIISGDGLSESLNTPVSATKFCCSGETISVGKVFSFTALASPETLQLTIVVNDDKRGNRQKSTPWDADSLEIFFDTAPDSMPNIEKSPLSMSRLFVCPKSANKLPASISHTGKIDVKAVKWYISEKDGGYVATLTIPWHALGLSKPEAIGFDIIANDSNGNARVAQTPWSGSGQNYRNRLGYGRFLP